MDFIDQIRAIAERIPKQRDFINTEEATKMSLIAPFINALGYNVFDPREVVPEFTADIGTKKGEKVDYAIMINGEPVIMFECKSLGVPLDAHNSQLYRYFTAVPSARIGVLTNGIIYQFFSDIESKNVMDIKPFLEFNMLDIQTELVEELKRITKSAFNLGEMLCAAVELKYMREIKRLLNQEYVEPTEDFVRFFASRIYPGPVRQKIVEQFTELVKTSFRQFVSERVSARLKSALAEENAPRQPEVEEEEAAAEEERSADGIVTTEEELEGYRIVCAIAREVVPVARIHHRDTKSYCGVLLDNTNRKPICRLRFNNSDNKKIGLFDDDKKESCFPIENLSDIYRHAEQIKATILAYDHAQAEAAKRKQAAAAAAGDSAEAAE